MTKQVLTYVLIAMVFILIALWLYSGGFAAARSFVRTVPNPISIFAGISSSTYNMTFPNAMPFPQGPDISGIVDEGNAQLDAMQSDSESSDAEGSDTSSTNTSSASARSPYADSISLSVGGAMENDPNREYLEIEANSSNTGPVVVSGWSILSARNKTRVYLPQATTLPLPGRANAVGPITLSPGARLIVRSGISPIGVSFEDNVCTDYLTGTSPSEAAYGQCLNASDRTSRSFLRSSWHAYLGYTTSLWSDQGDTIRLLDGSAHVVASISY